jgi:hypothetical protein
MLKWFIAVVVLYCGFVALLYGAQRSLQYFPERRRTAPRAVGLPEAEEAVLDTADGERVIVWHVPPREGRPVFFYFHGNGEPAEREMLFTGELLVSKEDHLVTKECLMDFVKGRVIEFRQVDAANLSADVDGQWLNHNFIGRPADQIIWQIGNVTANSLLRRSVTSMAPG